MKHFNFRSIHACVLDLLIDVWSRELQEDWHSGLCKRRRRRKDDFHVSKKIHVIKNQKNTHTQDQMTLVEMKRFTERRVVIKSKFTFLESSSTKEWWWSALHVGWAVGSRIKGTSHSVKERGCNLTNIFRLPEHTTKAKNVVSTHTATTTIEERRIQQRTAKPTNLQDDEIHYDMAKLGPFFGNPQLDRSAITIKFRNPLPASCVSITNLFFSQVGSVGWNCHGDQFEEFLYGREGECDELSLKAVFLVLVRGEGSQVPRVQTVSNRSRLQRSIHQNKRGWDEWQSWCGNRPGRTPVRWWQLIEWKEKHKESGQHFWGRKRIAHVWGEKQMNLPHRQSQVLHLCWCNQRRGCQQSLGHPLSPSYSLQSKKFSKFQECGNIVIRNRTNIQQQLRQQFEGRSKQQQLYQELWSWWQIVGQALEEWGPDLFGARLQQKRREQRQGQGLQTSWWWCYGSRLNYSDFRKWAKTWCYVIFTMFMGSVPWHKLSANQTISN